MTAAVGRDRLEQVAREYRHAREEHRRARHGSAARRHLGSQLADLEARFERLLAEAALDEDARRRWRDHLRHGRVEPEEPAPLAPLLFRGRSDRGSQLRILGRPDGSIEALVDGVRTALFDSAEELGATAPGLLFQVDGTAFRETFVASRRARAALRVSLEAGGPLEPRFVGELLADGLIDGNLDLTRRGRRALALDTSPARTVLPRPGTVSIRVRGPLRESARVALEAMLNRVCEVAPRPVLHARGSVERERNPSLERPVVAKAQLDLGGIVVRSHVAAATTREAVDLLEARLRGRLLDLAEREEARRVARPPATERSSGGPAVVERASERRRLVRRKSFAAAAMSPEEAAWEMRLLDHDFHLFADAASGDDAFVYLREDGVLAIKRIAGGGGYVDGFVLDPEPAPRLTVEGAVERLNATGERAVFFVDSATGRGAVVYRRYDGHYGLLATDDGDR